MYVFSPLGSFVEYKPPTLPPLSRPKVCGDLFSRDIQADFTRKTGRLIFDFSGHGSIPSI